MRLANLLTLLCSPLLLSEAFITKRVEPNHLLRLRTSSEPPLTHADIRWKIRLPPTASKWDRFLVKLSGLGVRIYCRLKRQKPPTVLCPKGGQVVLEAWSAGGGPKIGRFGITTQAGPPLPALQETVKDSFNINQMVRTAAIIYMFVEPEWRGRNVGYLALQAISFVHAVQGCDFTVLVADDKTEEKTLVQWYERYGYVRAPKLQVRSDGLPQ